MKMATKLDTNFKGREILDSVVIRFAGDSGDGMQLTGTQFTQSTALMGNDLSTFPDFPAEIRAPVGTTFGVSAFQINFASHSIKTPGDRPDVLVAMNPAALKVHLSDLASSGLVIVNTGTFNPRNIKKAGYDTDPLEDNTLEFFRSIKIDISKLTLASVEGLGLSKRDALRCKNIWTLGLMCWMYGRERQSTLEWLESRFSDRPNIAKANVAALNAGHSYGETAEISADLATFIVPKAEKKPGIYRAVTGIETTTWGLLAGAEKTGLKLFFGSYPITPASPLLHSLSNLREHGVITFQAEDEISAICAAIGASFSGCLGITSSSGPGIALKTEAMGLAVSTELPLIIINFQRAGPSTGMPTKTEQSDLLQAVWGRNGDTPMPVISASTPSDCFECAVEAVRLATKYMTPVMFLNEGYLANAAEPWRIPDVENIEEFPVSFHTEKTDFQPYNRNEQTLARPWVVPGTPGLEHRIGGIEKDYDSGNISYDADNHHKMTKVRAAKINNISNDIPDQEIANGAESGKLLVVGWGSTFGAIEQAVRRCRSDGLQVSQLHIRHIWPMPKNIFKLLSNFEKILVPEINNGQLVKLLKAEYLIAAESFTQINGKPFKVADLEAQIRTRLENLK